MPHPIIDGAVSTMMNQQTHHSLRPRGGIFAPTCKLQVRLAAPTFLQIKNAAHSIERVRIWMGPGVAYACH